MISTLLYHDIDKLHWKSWNLKIWFSRSNYSDTLEMGFESHEWYRWVVLTESGNFFPEEAISQTPEDNSCVTSISLVCGKTQWYGILCGFKADISDHSTCEKFKSVLLYPWRSIAQTSAEMYKKQWSLFTSMTLTSIFNFFVCFFNFFHLEKPDWNDYSQI